MNLVLAYSRIEILMVCDSSMNINPRTRRAHSVTRVTTTNVNPRDESWYRLRKVIKNPNPPMSIIWTSIITEGNNFFENIQNLSPNQDLGN